MECYKVSPIMISVMVMFYKNEWTWIIYVFPVEEELNQISPLILDSSVSCVEQEEIFGPVLLCMQVC